MTREERLKPILAWFQKNQPQAETELNYASPFQLLAAVILSAQCTDKRVNLITPALFSRFPQAADMAIASLEEVFSLIRSCSYPNNKAKNLIAMAQMLEGTFGGIVPHEIEQLQKLPGVGRKTANVIASVVFHKPALAVDTHVFRVAARIGLTTNARTPLETEKQLVSQLPPDLIPKFHHWLILHGRYVCQARKPLCHQCGISAWCRFIEKPNNP